ncbi:MAG TPA: peptidase M48, partial [Gammaproteobacteria bacterium]|nr:peptidase M48 [Gammaproteobacteria bacterium]
MQKNKIPLLPILLIGSLFFLTSCLVNPVTGKRELGVVTQDQEIAIGTEQYGSTQQIQGGTYSVDLALERYVQRVGHRIAEVSGVDLPYEFVVVNNSTPNA